MPKGKSLFQFSRLGEKRPGGSWFWTSKKPIDKVQRAKDFQKAKDNFLKRHNFDTIKLRTLLDVIGETEFIKR
jgi:hypothetical protein